MRRYHLLFLLIVALAALPVLSGCSGQSGSQLEMAPLEQMPAEVRSAPAVVAEAYRFAVANPDVMKQIPCYCGCGAMGHSSNYACYVAGVDDDGQLIFDPHALGCGICVDITQDVIRLQRQGRSVVEIRAFIDQTYSQYGPSNMP